MIENHTIEQTTIEQTGRRAINSHAHIPDGCSQPQQPRAIGRAVVSSKFTDAQSRLDRLHQSGAFKLLFPYGRRDLEVVCINTAGGITGGDRFNLEARAGHNSRLTLTTQAAERAYRAQPGEVGEILTTLDVEKGAQLNWLPQETILFQKCRFRRSLRINLALDAQFLAVEPVVFGRAAMGEVITDAHFHDRIEIFQDNTKIYHDAVRLSGNISRFFGRMSPAAKIHIGAYANIILIAPTAESARDWLRPFLENTDVFYGGASLLAPDVLCCRIIAQDSYLLRKALIPILDRLTENNLPRCWRL